MHIFSNDMLKDHRDIRPHSTHGHQGWVNNSIFFIIYCKDSSCIICHAYFFIIYCKNSQSALFFINITLSHHTSYPNTLYICFKTPGIFFYNIFNPTHIPDWVNLASQLVCQPFHAALLGVCRRGGITTI